MNILNEQDSNSNQDTYNLKRFISAQDNYDTYKKVIKELPNGKKESHWMWYIFPQIKGLGTSSTSQLYGIGSIAEVEAYMQKPELSFRLIECCEILLHLQNKTSIEIFGYIDALKLKSSMTLFGEASNNPVFKQVLDKYYNGEKDELTLKILNETKQS